MLREERRLLFAQAFTARLNPKPGEVSRPRDMRRLASEIALLTKVASLPETLFQIIEWRMVGERVERIEAMGRA